MAGNQTFPEASQYLMPFLDCSENLGIQKSPSPLPCWGTWYCVPQDLAASLLVPSAVCMLPCGVWIRHTSGFMAHFQGRRSLGAIQIFFSVWFTNHRSPSELWGWNNACRDELLIEFPNACSTNQTKAAMCFCKENLPYMNLCNIAVLLVVCKTRTITYFLLISPVAINL